MSKDKPGKVKRMPGKAVSVRNVVEMRVTDEEIWYCKKCNSSTCQHFLEHDKEHIHYVRR